MKYYFAYYCQHKKTGDQISIIAVISNFLLETCLDLTLSGMIALSRTPLSTLDNNKVLFQWMGAVIAMLLLTVGPFLLARASQTFHKSISLAEDKRKTIDEINISNYSDLFDGLRVKHKSSLAAHGVFISRRYIIALLLIFGP